jgi:lipopolysaccharide export system permease protein
MYYVFLVAIMMAFFIFIDFMEHIDRVTRQHSELASIGLYYIYFLPRIFVEISWISFLVAMMIVLGGLAKNNEFTAMLAGGISIYRVGFPVVIIGIALSMGVFVVQEFAMPPAMLRVYDIREHDFSKDSAESRIFQVAGIGRHNMLYFFDVLDVGNGVITGLQIHTKKGGSIVERIDAETASWDNDSRRWLMSNGVIRKFDSDGAVIEKTAFPEMKAPFRESPRTLRAYASEKGEYNFLQLRRKIRNLRRSGYDAHNLRVDYQKKFALPLANLIVVLLGIPFALECRRGSLIIGFGLSLVAALLYYGAFQVSLVLGKGGIFSAVIAAWSANILFLVIGAGLTLRART